jgi:hypothetical protein
MGRVVLCGLLACSLGCGGRTLPESEIEAVADASDDAIARFGGTVADGAGDGRSNEDDGAPPDDARLPEGRADAGRGGAGNDGSLACPSSSIVDSPGPGVLACIMGSALISCTYASGDLCVCLSNDRAACPPGRCPAGGSCTSLCGSGDFALYCGGPPLIPAPDGAPNAYVTYQDAPAACAQAGPTFTEGENVCCPCD